MAYRDTDAVVLEHCRTWILRLVHEGRGKAEIAEAVGCSTDVVTRAMESAQAYDRQIATALADCREPVAYHMRAWHSWKGLSSRRAWVGEEQGEC